MVIVRSFGAGLSAISNLPPSCKVKQKAKRASNRQDYLVSLYVCLFSFFTLCLCIPLFSDRFILVVCRSNLPPSLCFALLLPRALPPRWTKPHSIFSVFSLYFLALFILQSSLLFFSPSFRKDAWKTANSTVANTAPTVGAIQ